MARIPQGQVNRPVEAEVLAVIQQSQHTPEIQAILALLKYKEDAALRLMRDASPDTLAFARDRWKVYLTLAEEIRRAPYTLTLRGEQHG